MEGGGMSKQGCLFALASTSTRSKLTAVEMLTCRNSYMAVNGSNSVDALCYRHLAKPMRNSATSTTLGAILVKQ